MRQRDVAGVQKSMFSRSRQQQHWPRMPSATNANEFLWQLHAFSDDPKRKRRIEDAAMIRTKAEWVNIGGVRAIRCQKYTEDCVNGFHDFIPMDFMSMDFMILCLCSVDFVRSTDFTQDSIYSELNIPWVCRVALVLAVFRWNASTDALRRFHVRHFTYP